MFLRIITVMLVSVIMAGCGTSASTPVPTKTPEPEPTVSAQQETVPQTNGEVLFNTFVEKVGFACATCHYTDSDRRLIGPGLLSIATRFEGYEVEAENLESYLRESILDPHAFLVPETPAYPDNLMPDRYSEIFTEDEIKDLVDYILSLGEAA